MTSEEIARNMEKDAIDFYREAAEKTSHPVGKKIFLSIMEDEKRHLQYVEALIKGMDITPETVNPMRNIRTVFEEMKDELVGGIQATADEVDALSMAMKMEREGREFYERIVKESTDPKSRALFEKLIREEEKHYEIFSNTLNFLQDTGNWFMWDEHSMVDGGTPWA